MNRRLKISSVILALLLGWILIAPILAEILIVEKPLDKADAILVLGGSAVYLERTRKAAEIYKNGVAPVIILTDDGERAGWSRAEKRNPAYVELAQRNLISEGVPVAAIVILQPEGSGTIYEAQILAEKAQAENTQKLLIVTSAYHTRRALWTFEKIFAESNVKTELGIAAPPTGEQTPPPTFWWISPNGWKTVAGEYVKFPVYWVYY